MVGTVEKIKDILHVNKDHSTTGTTHNTHSGVPEGTAGPHSSRAANAADPRIDSDLDSSRGHTGTHTTNTHTGTTGAYNPTTGSTNHGPHNSNLLNKADPRIDSDRDGSHNTHTGTTGAYNPNTGSTNHGPHDSNLLNKADPRVDSDRDGSHNLGGNTHSTTAYGSTGLTGTHGTSTNHGPHDSNLLNKADPRIDSDRDGSHNTHTGTTGAYNPNTGSTNHGPHNSNLLNKADPRVDSDRDGSRNLGAATGTGYSGTQTGNHLPGQHAGTTGGISHSTNAGPHNSNLANKADPRVDSDLDSTGNRHGAHNGGVFGTSGSHATPGSGTAQNTAGPHNSDLLNKLDPRVDADLDGSKTYGGNKTHA